MFMPGGFGAGAGAMMDVMNKSLDFGFNVLGNAIARGQSEEFVRDMWKRQNEYNKPINQVARAREAGLNPYAMLQQGGFTSGNAEQASSVPPAYSDYSPGFNMTGALNTAANTRLVNSEASLNEIDAETQSLKNRRELDNMYKHGLISDEEYKKYINENSDFQRRRDNDQRAQDDAHDLAEFQKDIQEVVARYMPAMQAANLDRVLSENDSLLASARAGNTQAALNLAEILFSEAKKRGVDLDNEVKEKTKKDIISKARSERRRASEEANEARNRADQAAEEAKKANSVNRRGSLIYHVMGGDRYDPSNPYVRSDPRYRSRSRNGGVR